VQRATPRRNLLYVITSSDIGGEERHLFHLARYMRDGGHHVQVCSLRERGAIGRKLEADGFPLMSFNESEKPSAHTLLQNARRLGAFIRDQQIDLVHSFLVRANVETRLAGWLSGTRCAVINSEACINLRKSSTSIWLDRSTCRWCDVVLANSRAVADVLSRRERVPASKIRIVYQGIDVTRFGRDGHRASYGPTRPQDVVIGYVGRLHPEKGPRFLIDAASRVARTTDAFQVVIVGDGAERESLQAMAGSLGVSRRVRFVGMQSDVASFMRTFDILVIPSLEEGLPTVAMEALACGVPVVATAVGGTPEVIDHRRTGLLVPPADPAALADALVTLLTNAPLRQRLGQLGPRVVEDRFQATRMLTQTAAIYDEVLQTVTERASSAA
jgi:glycosyltransferase involved in cell wall biosynthesis